MRTQCVMLATHAHSLTNVHVCVVCRWQQCLIHALTHSCTVSFMHSRQIQAGRDGDGINMQVELLQLQLAGAEADTQLPTCTVHR